MMLGALNMDAQKGIRMPAPLIKTGHCGLQLKYKNP
jgi:hypothetical protein